MISVIKNIVPKDILLYIQLPAKLKYESDFDIEDL